MRRSGVKPLALAISLCVLTGCGNVAGKELPMVRNNDPTWALIPDHLEFGALPK
jgi:hypothetical protein